MCLCMLDTRICILYIVFHVDANNMEQPSNVFFNESLQAHTSATIYHCAIPARATTSVQFSLLSVIGRQGWALDCNW